MPRITIADRAEYPGTIYLVFIMLGIEDPVPFRIPTMNRRIFRMHMPNSPFERANGRAGIYPLPEQVRRIEVCPYDRPGRFAQFEQCFGIINDKARMHLKPNLADAILFGEGDSF